MKLEGKSSIVVEKDNFNDHGGSLAYLNFSNLPGVCYIGSPSIFDA